jgi:hypothetical protein
MTIFYRARRCRTSTAFLSLHRLTQGRFAFMRRDKVAFFPRHFDPFTLSHKGIVGPSATWSLRCFCRRRVLVVQKDPADPHPAEDRHMSVADEFDVSCSPTTSGQLANPGDQRRLAQVFAGRSSIRVGSDVIGSASSYCCAPSGLHPFDDHSSFAARGGLTSRRRGPRQLKRITGKLIELLLPNHLEDHHLHAFRENIDLKRDNATSRPLCRNHLPNSLYLREPIKAELSAQVLTSRSARPTGLVEELVQALPHERRRGGRLALGRGRGQRRHGAAQRPLNGSVMAFGMRTIARRLFSFLNNARLTTRCAKFLRSHLLLSGVTSAGSSLPTTPSSFADESLAQAVAEGCGCALFLPHTEAAPAAARGAAGGRACRPVARGNGFVELFAVTCARRWRS